MEAYKVEKRNVKRCTYIRASIKDVNEQYERKTNQGIDGNRKF